MYYDMIPPVKRPLIIQGPVIYNDAARWKNTIKFKKKLKEEFPDLKKPDKIIYTLEYWKNYKDFLERAKEIVKNKKGVPIFLFLAKE